MNTRNDFSPMPDWLQQAWLQRYLERRLSAEECAWFEAYVLDKPELLDQVEADNALRAVVCAEPQSFAAGGEGPGDGAAASTAAAVVQPLPRDAGPQRRASALGRWALAASFVAGIGFGALALQGLVGSDEAAQDESAGAPPRLVYDSLRGSYSGPREDRGDPRARLMIVDIAMPLGSRIVRAEAELGERRVELPPALISGEGFATYTLPRSWRGRGRLHFELQDSSGATADPIEVTL